MGTPGLGWLGGARTLSHTMYSLNGFRKSTALESHQLVVSTSNGQQEVDDLAGDLNFYNHLIDTFREIRQDGHTQQGPRL